MKVIQTATPHINSDSLNGCINMDADKIPATTKLSTIQVFILSRFIGNRELQGVGLNVGKREPSWFVHSLNFSLGKIPVAVVEGVLRVLLPEVCDIERRTGVRIDLDRWVRGKSGPTDPLCRE